MSDALSFTAHASTKKRHGAVYTPDDLGRFLAERIWAASVKKDEMTAMDPACGDSELLLALEHEAKGIKKLSLKGVDLDEAAIVESKNRFNTLNVVSDQNVEVIATLIQSDFMDLDPDFLVDLIIANPPYVRTQALGREVSRALAQRFGLSGRVDLSTAFAFHMTSFLKPGGTLGLLTSNRFMTTQAGVELRNFLSDQFVIQEIIDLGDTKLFEGAAVLPVIVIATKKPTSEDRVQAPFRKIYEQRDAEGSVAHEFDSVLEALRQKAQGRVLVDKRIYEIEEGQFPSEREKGSLWVPVRERSWLKTVDRNTAQRFGDLLKIRVGIKTTADKVFIRTDWKSLPDDRRPENELLYHLITHHVAGRFRASEETPRQVLYTHLIRNGKREAIDLARYPRARAYLESHRKRLAGRDYIAKAKRNWYEIWVPQDPAMWTREKLVFPDISEAPKFFIDEGKSVVNGDCYWAVKPDDMPSSQFSLLVAIANSSLATAYYDERCANKLYAGRRRYITQYVNTFPVPDCDPALQSEIHKLVQELKGGTAYASAEAKLDELVWKSFGLRKP